MTICVCVYNFAFKECGVDKKFPPIMNPDNNDLSNDLLDDIGKDEATDYYPLKAILLILCALLCFSCMDTTIKYLVMKYNAPLVVAIRYIVHCSLMAVILIPTYGKRLVKTQRTGLVLVRGTCLLIVSIFIGSALKFMPVAEMTAIAFLAPMLVMLMARPVLGEKIGVLGWVAALGGFLGVLMIVRPGSGLNMMAVFYMVFAVIANALYQLLSRVLANTERTITLLFYTALIGAVCLGVTLPWHLEGESPDAVTILLFLSIGVTGGVGHFLYTKAFRHAPASMIAPINYLQLLWSGILGWIIFDHVPDKFSILGMCIIAISGVLIAVKSISPGAFSLDFVKQFFIRNK